MAKSAARKPSDRRRFNRIEPEMQGLADCGARELPVRVIDLSSNGAQLQFSGGAPDESVTRVSLPQLAENLACETMWRRGDRIGLRFTDKPYEVSARLPVGLRVRLLNG